jgi:hypothetical protein
MTLSNSPSLFGRFGGLFAAFGIVLVPALLLWRGIEPQWLWTVGVMLGLLQLAVVAYRTVVNHHRGEER